MEEIQLLRELIAGVPDHRAGKQAASRRLQTQTPKIELEKLEAVDDVEAFLTAFERIMTAQRTLFEQWTLLLAPLLTGKIQQAYAMMIAADAAQYQAVKDAILCWYDNNTKTYRQRFRQA